MMPDASTRPHTIELTATSRERIGMRLSVAARTPDLDRRATLVAECRAEALAMPVADARLLEAIDESEADLARALEVRRACG